MRQVPAPRSWDSSAVRNGVRICSWISLVVVVSTGVAVAAPALAPPASSDGGRTADSSVPPGHALERFAASRRTAADMSDLVAAVAGAGDEGTLIGTWFGLHAAPDLNGDGIADAVEVGNQRITVVDGASGKRLWSRPGLVILIAAAGRVDQVPGDDLLVWRVRSFGLTEPVDPGPFIALSGATGAQIWAREMAEEADLATNGSDFVAPVAAPVDLDGDSASDLVLGRYVAMGSGIVASSHYSVSGRTGATLARYGAGLAAPPGTQPDPYAFVVPDLSGDSRPDVVAAIARGKFTAIAAFAGATGVRRWEASFYSPGDDEMTHGFGGRFVSGAPADVALAFGFPGAPESQVWVLDGDDGTPLWDRTIGITGWESRFGTVAMPGPQDGIQFSGLTLDFESSIVGVLSGSGAPVWQRQGPYLAEPAGDVTGDGVDDLILAEWSTNIERVVSGAEGAELWSRGLGAFGRLHPLREDLDGDGFNDLIQATGEADSVAADYIAVSGSDGRHLWAQAHRALRTRELQYYLQPIDVRGAPGVDLIEGLETEDHPTAYALRPGDGGPPLWLLSL